MPFHFDLDVGVELLLEKGDNIIDHRPLIVNGKSNGDRFNYPRQNIPDKIYSNMKTVQIEKRNILL
ncbi:MAG: hypothetical protein F6K40_07050 [Okeania sp. SIO3I5]|nr:hypothetical protein [Okeania sp. SIO3I5]